MYIVFLIIVVAAIYHWGVAKPAQKKQAEATLEKAKQSSFTQETLRCAMGLASAAQQIKRAGQCRISPLMIQITDVDNVVARLNINFTIYGMRTNPFYDLEMSVLIASGSKLPKYVNISEADMEKVKEAKERILIDSIPYQKETERLIKLIEAESYEAIYQQLFGKNQNFFNHPIDGYDLKITQYPVGDVTVSCNWNALAVDSSRTYRKCFDYICSELRKNYTNAEITKSEREITVSF